MTRLGLDTLDRVAPGIRVPAFDPRALKRGMMHLGVGAFHRAHQAVFTDDAVAAAGGDWRILGVSLRHGATARALNGQDGLYTLEIRAAEPAYRVLGVLGPVLVGGEDPQAVLDGLAAPDIHVVTLTVTEPAYALNVQGRLDRTHADVAHDLRGNAPSRSVAGWLAAGLERRRDRGGRPLSIVSCDNLRSNGARLRGAVLEMASVREARASAPGLAAWIEREVAFPDTMVDAITPASDATLAARVARATGLQDCAAVQREPFAQWVIQDRFSGPRPAWERAGATLVCSVEDHEALKLHVLNAAHSALAYLGLPRGHVFVRQAIADPSLAQGVEAMVMEEIAPALPGLDVAGYWPTVRARLGEPAIDHRLDQIARDGSAKLRERIHPLILTNARAGRACPRLAAAVRAGMAFEGRRIEAALDDPALFAAPFRTEPAVRSAVLAP